ncbi:hypothetical protein SELMODRAFT_73763 [Selaginella moellendorffii]|uniref:U3 small nucleolar RNA-associated protein 11 n=1 Tax=Selaginella moellendorffii TaxID=88036 RepID=D8QMU9_SELML|nr:probable U3 small nucleolar RNA-associated protein 11 [Selaginella moellendorffii]EFJ37989.1 hypothetical protein SELMODRAFT_73763 [Selaginella moellendorffii]|eukprot:XP_002960450.1 probable U3 small nucleolar RNA-associated protein 11 [Selaginella moellendorffii]
MASLRNAVRRREHKERSQPSERARFGLLEKHKDYVLRAKDFHRKEKTIQTLQEKALTKNPDEFYHRMISTKTVNGVHRPKSLAKQYTQEELLLMKTQDVKYILCKAQSEQKKVDRLQAVLHGLDKARENQHSYFAENGDEVNEMRGNLTNGEAPSSSSDLPLEVNRDREAAYNELAQRKERLEKLKSMVITMSMQKEIMGKGRKRKMKSDELVTPSSMPVFKWRNERKK